MNSTKQRNLVRGAEHWFEKGVEAMDCRNWDYALECLGQAVRLEPSHLESRKQKHRSSRRRFGRRGPVPKVATVRLAAIRSRIRTALIRDDWLNVDKLAEDGNAINPWEAEFYALIARAASRFGNLKIARYAWTSAVKLEPDNARFYREFGGVLQRLGDYELARECYLRIDAIDPTGQVSAELVAAVDIAAVIHDGGYSAAETTRDVAMDDPHDAACDGIEVEEESLDIEHDLREELRQMVTAGETHVQAGRLCSALECFKSARELAPQNRSIRRRHEDVELAWLRQQAITAQDEARFHATLDEPQQTAAARAKDLMNRELQIREARVAEADDDCLAAFQLADLYRRSSRFTDAVPLFERAAGEENLKAESLIGLGECLIHSQKASLGHRYLVTALSMIEAGHKPNAFKLAHYWLGRLYEAQNYQEQAEQHFLTIARLDPGFRDIEHRLSRDRP